MHQPRGGLALYGALTLKTGCSSQAAPLVELQRPWFTGRVLVACQPSQKASPVNLTLVGAAKSWSDSWLTERSAARSFRALSNRVLRLAAGISTTRQSVTASLVFWVISTCKSPS